MRPSSAMKSVCSQALEWHRDYPDRREFVDAWMLRFARSTGTAKQWATVERVHQWFHDHADFRGAPKFFNDDDPGPERIAWDLLGGDAGQSWASKAMDAGPDEYSSTMEIVEATLSAAATPALATFQLRASDWADPDVFASFEGRNPEWAGLLCFEEVLTSDNRIISADSLTWRKLPFTLQDQLQSQVGHDGAVPVGPTISINRIDPAEVARLTDGVVEVPDEGFGIWGAGLFDSGEDGGRARRRIDEGTKQGVSVDLTEVVLDLPEDPEEAMEILFGNGILRIKSAKIAAATLVAIPAFEDARLRIIGDIPDEVDAEALVASGGLIDGLTLTVVTPFTGVFVERMTDGALTVADTEAPSGDAGLVLVDDDPEDPADDEELAGDDLLQYSTEHLDTLVASGGTRRPPSAWFKPAEYDEPTPLTLGDPDPDHHGLRRLHGHLGVKGSCHTSYADRCIDIPMGLDYDSFQGGRAAGTVSCSDGVKVKAGPIVMSTEHAPIRDARGRQVPVGQVIDHYAHTGCLVAQGRCYEDRWGVQVQGWVLPDVTDEQLARLDACDLSPDWRGRATARGGRGVLALLTVNVSGFNTALVASAAPVVTSYRRGVPDAPWVMSTTTTTTATAVLVADEAAAPAEPEQPEWEQEQQLAARKVAVLDMLGVQIPDALAQLAQASEELSVTFRKSQLLEFLHDTNGEVCSCGGACCN